MSEETDIATHLRDASTRLADCSESPRLDAEILLGRAIDMPRSYLFAHPEDAPDPAAVARFEKDLERRLAGEPMAYITGHREFWSMELMVTPATLVPRPETEILVDLALQEIPRDVAWNVLDLGTGSGAIALAIGRERPLCSIVATDQSAAALRVAEQNARQYDVANIEFIEGSWTTPLGDRRFDLIVSNPPYIRAGDAALAQLRQEPQSALVAGNDGLDDIRHLAAACGKHLVEGRALMLEHGADQEAEVARILADAGWTEIACTRDFAGLPRISTARKPASRRDL